MMDYAGRSHKMRQQLDAITRDQDVIAFFFEEKGKKSSCSVALLAGLGFLVILQINT